MEDKPNYKSLFDFSPVPSCVCDIHTFEIYVANRAAGETLEISKDYLVSKLITDLFVIADSSIFNTIDDSSINEDRQLQFGTFKYRNESGVQKEFKVRGERVDFQNRECVILAFEIVDSNKDKGLIAQKLLDSSIDIFCTVNKEGNFTYISAAAEKRWGYTPEELIDTPFKKLLHKEDIPKSMVVFDEIMNGNDINTFVNRYIKKNGEIAHNLWSSRWDEKEGLIYGVVRDYNDLTEKEKERRLQQQRFEHLILGAFDLIGVANEKGYYTYMSPSCIKITGLPPEVFVGTNAFEFVHPDDMEQVKADFEKSIAEGRVDMKLYRARNGDNEWRWVETILTNLLDEPSVNGIVINSRDVTEIVEEKEHLKLLESVITHTKDAVLIAEVSQHEESESRIIYVNEAFTKMTGYNTHEVIGKTPRILQGPNSNKEELVKLRRAVRNWEPCEVTTINYKKSGEEFWINYSVSPLAYENDDFTHWVAIQRDITEEKKLRDLYEQANELTQFGSWEYNTLDGSLTWTEEIHKLHGTDPESFQPTVENTLGFCREDFHEQIESSFGQAINEGKPFDFEAVIITTENKEEWVRTIGRPKIVDGKVVRLYGSIQNISNLKDSENKLLDFSDNLPGIVLQYTTYQDGTDSFDLVLGDIDKIWGLEKSQVENSTDVVWAGIRAGGDILTLEESIQKSIETKSKWSCRSRYVNPSGEMKTHLVFGSPYFNSDGSVTFNSVILDITEQALNEEILEHTHKMASIGNWEVNMVDRSVYWSEEVHRLHGTDPKTYAPNLETAISFYREDFREMVSTVIEKAIIEGGEWDFEAVLVSTDKKERWVYSIGNADIVNGECTRLYGGFQDIHERKLMELELNKLNSELKKYTLELERSNEELEQFAFIASHDLQEPLRMVSNFMNQLERKYGDQLDEKAHQYIHFATDGAKRMKGIILDLLEYSRASRVLGEKEKELVDTNLLVDDFIKLRRKLISEKSAKIEYRDLPVISTYKAALTQIINCLLGNALKYSRQDIPARIKILAKEHDEEWEFSVQDNGIGVEAKFFDKIFVIFQRLHNQKEYEGTGIGLSVAKRHVEVLGGRIWLESDLEKGSIFYFTLPKVNNN